MLEFDNTQKEIERMAKFGQAHCKNYCQLKKIKTTIEGINKKFGFDMFTIPSNTNSCQECDNNFEIMPYRKCYQQLVLMSYTRERI